MSGILLALKIVALKMTILIRPSPKFLNSLPFIEKFYPPPEWEGKVLFILPLPN